MAHLLKQSTAYTFRLGPFLDSTDGNTQENALTIAAADVLLSKAGGALAAKNEATALTGTGANAHYTCILNTTDTNTLGTFRVWCHITGALAVWQDFMVLPANIYDSVVAGSDLIDVSVTQWLGTACAAPTVGGVPEVDLTHVAGTITNVSALATNVDAILTDTGTTLQAELDGIQTDTEDIQARLPAALTVGGNIKADALAWAGTATAATDIALKDTLAKGTDITGFNDLSAAQVNTEVDTAIADARLDELLAADSDIDGLTPPTVGSVVHELMTKTAGSFTYDQATDSLEALRDRGDIAWITAAGFSTHSAADVWTVATRALTDKVDFSILAANRATLVDEIWDEDVDASHQTAGTAGKKLDDAGGAADPWSTALPGAYGAGTAGNILGNRLIGTIATGTHNPQSGDAYAIVNHVTYGNSAIETLVDDLESRLGTPSNLGSGATVAANLVDIEGQTDDIGVAGAGLTAIPKTGYRLSSTGIDDILDEIVEGQGSYTLRQASSINLSILAGVTSDNGATLKSPNGTATRVAATIDANNNRTAMTLTPST